MSNDDKVWVEAEKSPTTDEVVLTLVDVPLRRQLLKDYGVHNAYVNSLTRIGTFPAQFKERFAMGYPIRFRMNLRGFESLLNAKQVERLGELDGEKTNKKGLTLNQWWYLTGVTWTLLVEANDKMVAAWKKGEDPAKYKNFRG